MRTRDGDTPLTLASAGGHATVVRRLLASRVDVDAQNRAGDTALILASRAGNVDTVSALVAAGAKRQLRNRDGVAAVDAAKAHGLEAVAALVK